MKRTLALIVICCMVMTMLASCDLVEEIKKLLNPQPPVCTEHVDADADEKCDVCGEAVPAPKPPVCEEHKDEDGDEKCDVCGADVPKPQPPVCDEHKDEDGDEKCDVCGADVPKPQPPACTEHKDEDGDYKCDACEYVMFEDVSYGIIFGDLETGKRAEDEINSKFTIVSGTEIRNRKKTFTDPETGESWEYTKSVKIGADANMIKVSVPGTGKLIFYVQNGSSGAEIQYITVTAPDGTKKDIEFAGTSEGSPLVRIVVDVTEGEWIIGRGKNGGTQDIYEIKLDCKVAVAPESGFELVATGKIDFLANEELDLSGLRFNAVFENGKTDPLDLSALTVDTSKVDMTKEGTYEVVISYKDYDSIKINVRVFQPAEIRLGLDAVEQNGSSGAGNGIYFNYSFKEVYAIGEELSTKGLSVIVIAKCGEDSVQFRVTDYTIAGFDSATAGAKTLTISYGGVSTTIDVYVAATAPTADENGVYHALVDGSYKGEIGKLEGGRHLFSTIQQALDFLAGADAAAHKVLEIAPGHYEEKLEVTIPNLTIIGLGEKPEDVVIEWNSLYGLLDDSGFSHVTDSTQTVAVRDGAVNCVIENVTISNYWNSQERMDLHGLEIERGLALLVMGDRFIMRNSILLGIQDTLELFTGRQLFENVYISGYTDFIFGTNNTTYFKNCTIHVIDTVKDDKGTAGYLTAFKGSNKGAADAITYGAIFDGCKFTADEGVMPGKTAIGRTWGAYAAVAIINSELGGHISKDGYNSAENKNKRYISMNGTHPTDETVQFVEFNNTGDGAISAAVAGMRMLTAEEAALYADFAVIFGKTNRNVSYLDAWDPASEEVVVDDRDYYYFTTDTSPTGTNHSFDTTTVIATGSTYEWDGLLISAENGKVAWNQNAGSLNMKAGAFVKFNVKAGTTVTIETHNGYAAFTINGVATSSPTTLSRYFAEDTEVVILSTGDLYLRTIIIDPNCEAPEEPTLNEIKVSGMNVNYTVGEDVSLEGVVLKALYSDFSVLVPSDYSVDTSAVDKNAAGAYDVVFTYGGKSVTVTVTYEDPNSDPAITKDTVLDFTSEDGYNAVANNTRVTMTGSFRNNGSEYQVTGTISFQVKAGTVVTVIPYYNSSYASFKIYAEGETSDLVLSEMHSMMFFEDCTVVYEGLSNNYLCQIIIECPLADGKYVFGGKNMEGDVTGILASIPGMSISGTCKTHSGGAQLGSDSQIIFIAPALATVTIQGFDTSYGQLKVLVDGEPVAMNDKAQYVFTAVYPATVVIEAVNVGTEESPAWNKSYITYIELSTPDFIEESITVNFGSEGNYKDCGIDFSGIQIGDNGGNNSQVKNGSFSFAVKKGATVTIHGYPGYTAYNLGDGDITYEGLTDEYFTYEAWSDCVITITPTSGNNYFYSIDIKYPVEVKKENVKITFGSEGNYTSVPALDMSGMKARDNGGNNTQLSSGSMKLTVLAGAKVAIHGYPNYTSYTVNDGVNTTAEITDTEYVYTAEADVELIITAVNSNNYLYGIDVTY